VDKGRRGRPKGSVGQAAILSPAQIKDVSQSARRDGRYADRAEIILVLSIQLGLRANELASLKWADVYHPDGTVREMIVVQRAYIRGAQSLVEVAGAPDLRGLLADYREKRAPFFNHYDQDPLFRSQRGGRMTAASVGRYLTGLDRMSANTVINGHSLRLALSRLAFLQVRRSGIHRPHGMR
jgi:integrase